MAVIDTSAIISNSNYDDVSGVFSVTLSAGYTLKEEAVVALLLAIESSAQGKRTNLDMPISEKAFPDSPADSIVSRANSDGSVTENQIEKMFQFVGWFKQTDLLPANAVSDAD